jgi:hypothetical protein
MTRCVRKPRWPWVLVGIIVGVVGAGGWPPAALAQPLPAAQVFPLVEDPVGDHATSPGNPVVDIGLVEGGADGTVVTLRITFSPETDMSQVAGVIALDTDQLPLTEGQGTRVDFFLDLRTLPLEGRVSVVDARSEMPVGTVLPVVTGQVLELTVPLALLGSDDGRMDLALVLGNGPEVTDTIFDTPLPWGPALLLTLTGCTACRAGDRLVVQARMTNGDTIDHVVEVKLGLWLPDGTVVNLLGTQHLEHPFPARLDATVPLVEYVWPAGLPPGRGTVEGRLLEPVLGGLWWESVHPFEVLP